MRAMRPMARSAPFWIRIPMTDFTLDFVSPVHYEQLAVEISYRGQILCRINKEQSADSMEVEFFHEYLLLNRKVDMKFQVSDFLSIFEKSCRDLREA